MCDDLVSRTCKPVDTVSPPVCGNRMFSMILDQTLDKLLCHKNVSFFGYGQCENLLVFCSIATHNQMYSEPALIAASSTVNSEILLLSLMISFWGDVSESLQNATWLLFTMCKQDNALATFPVGKPRNYKYKP